MKQFPLKFAVVGSGYRAGFYARIARRYPAMFQLLMFVCRSEEKRQKLEQETGFPAVTEPEKCAAASPDFVVIAVSKSSIASVAEEWSARGFPVVLETPAGASEQQLETLWRLRERAGARFFVSEQYFRYPSLVPGLRAIELGLLGEPDNAYLSIAHDYHGASLLRRMLQTGLEEFRIMGQQSRNRVVETDSRWGAITDGRIAEKTRDQMLFCFASGKTAVYDFSGLQYHSFIRSRHITVRGMRGEWNDHFLDFTDASLKLRHLRLEPAVSARYERLVKEGENAAHSTYSTYRILPEEKEACREALCDLFPGGAAGPLDMSSLQDEFAMASLLYDLKDALNEGIEVYPLAEALEDAYIWLKMQEAAAHPGEMICSGKRPWKTGREI